MSKSILLSIKPKWVAKILNGEKTIEIRKTMPKCDLPITVYIYCTKDKGKLVFDWETEQYQTFYENECNCEDNLNGKVVAKFTLRKVEHYRCMVYIAPKLVKVILKTTHLYSEQEKELLSSILENSCLSEKELAKYLEKETTAFSGFYTYHIEDLVIFDKPKELWEFKRASCKGCFAENTNYCDEKYCRITKAPQNFVFVESEE